jgi:hypothetical protein
MKVYRYLFTKTKYGMFVFGGPLMILLLAACAGTSGLIQATPTGHVDSPNSPPHLHRDDGSVVNTDGLFGSADLMEQIKAGGPIAVGLANESAQTVAITIPTMF